MFTGKGRLCCGSAALRRIRTVANHLGWTALFVDAEAIILDMGGMLRHDVIVPLEHSKPYVAGTQGVATTMQDGQLVVVDRTADVVGILE